jgi:AcrR family transcriptional regulator
MRTVDPAKHAAKRASIVDAAAGCFAEKGFERTTTADICRAAGISSGSLFHYFPTKRAVFTAIFTDDAARDDEFAELIQRNDGALRDGLAVRAVEARLIDPGVASRAAAGWVAGLIDAMISRASLDPDLDLPAEQAVLRTILVRFLRPVSPPDGA